jgi:hypothetical protein
MGLLGRFAHLDRREMPYGKPLRSAAKVQCRADPAFNPGADGGFRVSVGSASPLRSRYCGLPNLKQALGGIQVFIGDGAVLTVRRCSGKRDSWLVTRP